MLVTYSPAKVAAISAVFKSNGTRQCPTLVLLHMLAYGNDPAFLADPRLKYMPPHLRRSRDPAEVDGDRAPQDFAYSRKEFGKDLQVVGAMEEAELGFLAQAGLSPMQALQAATLNAPCSSAWKRTLAQLKKEKLPTSPGP